MSSAYADLGQLFMVAVSGTSLTNTERRLLQEMQPAGLTLFSRNLTEVQQICALNNDIYHQITDAVPIMAIDQEGGAKERLPVPPFTHWPGIPLLGKAFQQTGSAELTYKQYAGIGRELKALGFNTDFAPVADIIDPKQKTFIDDRAFSSDVKTVSSLTVACIEGLRSVGVLSCAKHFPGHGATSVDSHLDLPKIELLHDRLLQHDLKPFQAAINADCPLIMTAHILYPAMDKEHPATLSSAVLNQLLRQQMQFKGLIVTDDLNMHAISKRYPDLEAIERSFLAGSNLMLYCDGVERAFDFCKKLREKLQSKKNNDPLVVAVNNSLERLRSWKRNCLPSVYQPDAATALGHAKANKTVVEAISRFA